MEECTEKIELLKLRENQNIAKQATNCFHQKWGIPLRAYQESICGCLKNENVVPQWYLAMDNHVIVGGLGVIENHFHNRKDFTPNVCAVYVDEDYRYQSIAGRLLQYACDDMKKQELIRFFLLRIILTFMKNMAGNFCVWFKGMENQT